MGKALKYSDLSPALKKAVDEAEEREKRKPLPIAKTKQPSLDLSKIDSSSVSKKRESKYNARKVEFMGEMFDSVLERDRYIFLKAEQDAGRISNLRRQVEYELVPAQYKDETHLTAKGKVSTRKVLLERAVRYKADFVYNAPNGTLVVEDAKGRRTKEYIIKKKLMLLVHKVSIREIVRENVTEK